MNSNFIFSDPKMREEFLDRFKDLREDFINRSNVVPVSDDEKKELLAYTKDDANDAIKIVKEGLGKPILKVLEAIIKQYGRPAYFVRDDSFNTTNTPSTSEIVDNTVNNTKTVIEKVIPSVGRINLRRHKYPWVGTGYIVAKNILVTNRHVASEFAGREGDGFAFIGPAKASLDSVREFNSPKEKIYRLRKVLWIAPPSGSYDVAFLSVDEESYDDDKQPSPIELMDRETFNALSVEHWITVIGYPALSPYNNLDDQQRIFKGIYGVKRMQPGQIMAIRDDGIVHHDATTLGGNSGSPVIDLISGKAIALHFGGIEGNTNSAVAAPVVLDLLHKYVLQ
jgi:endonuclease G